MAQDNPRNPHLEDPLENPLQRPPTLESPSYTQELVLLALAWVYTLYRLYWSSPFPWSHNIHLPIHEAGHLLFTPFGEFMHFLGGSLFQVAFPLAFVVSFIFRREVFSAILVLIWCGDSLIDVSYYIGDAYAQQMPLIGGEHDWAYLLGELDKVHYATQLGTFTWWWGALLMLGACVGATFVLNQKAGFIRVKA